MTTSHIVSSIPGRIRLRDPVLRQPARLARLANALAALPAVESAEGNPRTGSIVLHYNAAMLSVDMMETTVEREMSALLHHADSALSLSPATRARLNRYSKYGMITSLSASLALAALGKKHWHIWTGSGFVGCLAIHLLVHRKKLLR